ncbi:ATP-binding cassette domain-containing protein [Rhodoferax sp.]|uniref:ABC transporter ATP-binding protein n=1 Tax=Rhodoferax sp. TaxID=50421 RepID=UPI0028457304|nr:ATP-binding cassette domain-containing protein [Rhodoferax sp.]MDR3367792.1 ATP-binding cassette domain-containing protein [Rhodoferax sp.]
MLLQVERLCFDYPQRALFKDFDADISAGVTLVLGDDGAGKTTLLRLLAGELAAQAGRLQVREVSLQSQPQAYQRHIFWADPQTQALDAVTPLQYFAQTRQRYPDFWPPDAPQFHELLAGLSLTEHLDKPLYMLSTGSKRKVWLASAFAAGASVTLLDDPFAALDKPSIRFVLQQLAAGACETERAWVVAHYEALDGVPLAQVIDLDVCGG